MKKILKENYKFLLTLILILILFSIKFPYYIDAPGGISDVSKKIEIDGYKSKGSFNLVYVKEYNATLPTLLLSLFNKDYKVLKKADVLLDNEDDKIYTLRDKILMEESISSAIYVAYKYADKKIAITNSKVIVAYIKENASTNLSVGDEIKNINGVSIQTRNDFKSLIDSMNIGDRLNITVENNGEEYNKYAYVIEEANKKMVGLLLCNILEFNTEPEVTVKTNYNESGSSGGLMTALSIYNSLVKEDMTNGKIVVGTGTIDLDGNVGSIGGVEYKLKSAVKNKADLFIVPNDENYDEAMKLKKENNYDIKIIGVSTFDEVISYLSNYKIYE